MDYKRISKYLFIVLIVVGSFFLGRRTVSSTAKNTPFKPQLERLASGDFRYTNPLIECEVYPQVNEVLTPFENKLQLIVDQAKATNKASEVALYYRDLLNGPWIGINMETTFSPASLLKVPLLMSVYEESDVNPDFLSKKLMFTKENDNTRQQYIVPSAGLSLDREYTISELLDRMVRFSDNDSASLISRAIDPKLFFKPYVTLGLKPPVVEDGDYFISVRKYVSFFRVLYNSTYLDRSLSEKALELLSKSEYKDGLEAGVPDGVRVAHKFGERKFEETGERQLHDCGIIYHPIRPFLMCVMTKGKSLNDLSSVIASLTETAYAEVDKNINASLR